MEFKDYYRVLGVERDADADAIKKAWRRLARRYHPDVNKAPDAAARMQDVNEAYEVLSDPDKRAAYDRVGSQWQAGEGFAPPPGRDAGFGFGRTEGAPFGDLHGHSDFFEALFGAAARRGRRASPIDDAAFAGSMFDEEPFAGSGFQGGDGDAGLGFARAAARTRGEDRHASITIALEDSFRGATRTLTLHEPVSGASGRARTRERQLQVTIPRGVRPGQRIRLAGQGAPGAHGGAPGDLYLEVRFEPHPLWRVEGRDLVLPLPLAPWEAALGARVHVPTPDGEVELAVPPGTAGGRRLRLKGRGLPSKPPGDLYAQVEIALPPADDAAVRAAYEQLARAARGFAPRRQQRA